MSRKSIVQERLSALESASSSSLRTKPFIVNSDKQNVRVNNSEVNLQAHKHNFKAKVEDETGNRTSINYEEDCSANSFPRIGSVREHVNTLNRKSKAKNKNTTTAPFKNDKRDKKIGKINPDHCEQQDVHTYKKRLTSTDEENKTGNGTSLNYFMRSNAIPPSETNPASSDVGGLNKALSFNVNSKTPILNDFRLSHPLNSLEEAQILRSKPSLANKKIPPIPPKPKYIDKIKPHPDMPTKSKELLQEKIKAYNNLANSKIKENMQTIRKDDRYSNDKIRLADMSQESLDACVENEYCVIVKCDNNRTNLLEEEEFNASSDEEMATEYDMIDNLNVTKITVERRYKVTDNENQRDSTLNVTRETYYDHNLNPRIEHISRNYEKIAYISKASPSASKDKSSLIIQELLQTELSYFKGLLRVYEDYITYFRDVSASAPLNINKVFSNFEEIYKNQFDFYGKLTECNYDVEAIADIFSENAKLFNFYEAYIINKHISSKYSTGECLQAIQERDKELGSNLNLESYLLTPVQRLFRYLMLLKNLQDALIKENRECLKLNVVVDYLDKLIERTNVHARVIQRIQDSPIDFSQKGRYLLNDTFMLKNNKRTYEAMVILFEDVIIFTQIVDSETYIYKDCIDLSDLYVRSIAEDLTSFQLQNFTQYRHKPDNKYIFDLEMTDPKTKTVWMQEIESLLWKQFAAHKKAT